MNTQEQGQQPYETLQLDSERELRAVLLKRSRELDGAWVASVLPFGGETRLYRFPNRSSIPDAFLGQTGMQERGVAIAGKFVPWTKAQIVREQNRGLTCE